MRPDLLGVAYGVLGGLALGLVILWAVDAVARWYTRRNTARRGQR